MTAFRLKTFPEILANFFASARALLGNTIDLNDGSVFRTIFESAALQDADQYIQIQKLLGIFSLFKCKGADIDRRALDYGAKYYHELRRRPAKTSIAKVSVGDGTLLITSNLITDYAVGATSFDITDNATALLFPTAGAVTIDRGTEREETVVYTRAGTTFTIVMPTTGFAYGHGINGEVVRVANKTALFAGYSAGVSSVVVKTNTGASWAATGTIIFERGTAREEKIAFTRVGDTFTLTTPTTFTHQIDSYVYEATNGSDRSISSGLTVYAPATDTTKQVTFRLLQSGVLYDGDFTSSLLDAESEAVGLDTRVGSHTITQFSSSPFAGATVTNPSPAARGANREEDVDYIERIWNFVQSTKFMGTAPVIARNLAGLRDPVTNEEVSFAQVVEPVSPGMSYVYITDGSANFTIDRTAFLGRDVLISDAEANDARGRLSRRGPFLKTASPVNARTPRLFASVERGSATSVGVGYLEDTTQAMVVNDYQNMYLKTDDDQFYLILSNTSIRFTLDTVVQPSLGSYSVYDFAGDPLEPDVDYTFNMTSGDVELTTPLAEHDGLVAADDNAASGVGAYSYSEGLAAYVQRTINGDETDLQNFPGYLASGTQMLVTAPTVVSPTLQIKVVAARGFSDSQLSPLVASVVQTYVNSLGIGDNILLSEIVRLVKGLTGVSDVIMVSPTANVTIPSGSIARITSDDIEVM